MDPSSFKTVDPTRSPPLYADFRTAWEGLYPGPGEIPIQVEAAAYHGKPVYFRIFEPWTPAGSAKREQKNRWASFFYLIFGIVALVTLLGGVFLAHRNFRLGRGDRKGALRFALCVLTCDYLAWVIKAHHVPELSELLRALIQFSLPLLSGCLVWIFYMALEPYVRRLWPEVIVSWVRLLDGRFRDPLVGRDLSLGVLTGVGFSLLDQFYRIVPGYLGLPAPRPDGGGPPIEFLFVTLRGMRYALGNFVTGLTVPLIFPMLFLVLLLILRISLRKQWLAVGAFLLLLAIIGNPADSGTNLYVYFIASLINGAIFLTVLFRVGLLAILVSSVVQFFLWSFPLTLDFSAWYAGNTFLVGLFLIVL